MKKVLISLLAIFMIATGGAVLYVLTLDLNKYKPQISKAVKDASGLELVVNGDISPSLSPLGLSVGGVMVSNPESFDKNTFFTMQTFDVALELMPLLNKEIKVKYVELSNVDINIIKSKDGKLNIETKAKDVAKQPAKTSEKEGKKADLPLVAVDKVLLSNINVTYTDLATNAKAFVKDADFVITNIKYDAKKDGLRALNFESDTKIANVIYDVYDISKIDANVALSDGVVTVSKADYTIFESRAEGSAKIDLRGKSPKVSVKEKVPALNLAIAVKKMANKDILEGSVDTDVSLSFAGADEKGIKATLEGYGNVVGKGVGIKGYDLDKILAKYDNTQKVDAKDIGAFLVAGPIGTLLTKGADVGSAFKDFEGGTTLLKDVVIKTDINKGIVLLKDVAIATGKNRIALKGSLDLPNEKFKDVSVGVLDEKGCAKYSQTIVGTFKKPSIKMDETAVKQVTNMVGSIFGKVKDILPVEDSKSGCTKPFYGGEVKHPIK